MEKIDIETVENYINEASKSILFAREILNKNKIYNIAWELSATDIILTEIKKLCITWEIKEFIRD